MVFSIQKFLGKEKVFFNLLESGAFQAYKCAEALKTLLADPSSEVPYSNIAEARTKNKEVLEEVGELLVKTFVTALEREDIEALADALYKIPKPIEKFSERFKMALRFVPDMNFQRQAIIIERAAGIVVEMLKGLKSGYNLQQIRELNNQLQQAETEADELETELLQELYSQRTNALRVLIVKDLYVLLEKAVDRCRDAGNVVTHIVLKNS